MFARVAAKTKRGLGDHSGRVNPFTRQFTETPDYFLVRSIACGTFGAVFEVRDVTGQSLAVKKVVQNPHYKNRELDILLKLHHPNCMHLQKAFYTREGSPAQTYLHIVSELFPTDLGQYCKSRRCLPESLLQLLSYQIFRGLAYLHSINICHRDVKPPNVLVDPASGRLQLCDFGSAKPLDPREPGVAYIATRSYRAPELLFDCTHYGFPIDVWGAGCVLAELANGGAIFWGESNAEMIIDIAQYIGPPTQADLDEYGTEKEFVGSRHVKRGLPDAFSGHISPTLLDLLERIFVYAPKARISADECLRHPFFEGVRKGTVRLPTGLPLGDD